MTKGVATYETRIADRGLYPLLEDIAGLMARLEHCLFVEHYVKGRPLANVKREMLIGFGVTGRQFNGTQRVLAGKVQAVGESAKLHLSSLQGRISSSKSWLKKKEKKAASLTKAIAIEEKRIPLLSKRTKAPDGAELAKLVAERKKLRSQVHNKKRYLASLEAELARTEDDMEKGYPRLCFGSRKLFRRQFNLETNGYRSHEDWLGDWKAKRASQFLCLGSHDETSGNQTLTHMPTGRLRLRVPPALKDKWGRRAELSPPVFPYGGDAVRAAWASDAPVTYRFLRRDNGWWYLQATVEAIPAPVVTIPAAGALGVDLNAGHVALGEIDRYGNPLWARSLAISVYKRSHAQIEACLGDVVAEIVGTAKLAGKPVVAEKLDFAAKRARLRELGGHRYARMLSGFAYAKFIELLRPRCAREGVELILVNPAYTSLIGLVKFAGGYGLTGHQAAAVAIARRGMGQRHKVCKCEDKATCGHAIVPEGLKERLTSKARSAPSLPVRNRGRHVWSDWNRYRKKLKEDFSLSRCRRPSEGECGGASAPSGVAPACRSSDRHGPGRDSAGHRDVAVPGREPPAEVGNAVRPAPMEHFSIV